METPLLESYVKVNHESQEIDCDRHAANESQFDSWIAESSTQIFFQVQSDMFSFQVKHPSWGVIWPFGVSLDIMPHAHRLYLMYLNPRLYLKNILSESWRRNSTAGMFKIGMN